MSDEIYYFTIDDLESLRDRATAAEARYKELLAGSHDTTSQTSETWHDNPAFDDVQQQSRMWYREFGKLKHLLDNARLIEADQAADEVVKIGDRVHVLVNDRARFDVVVCSYRCFHESTDDIEFISYAAPLAAALLERRAGERVSFNTGDRVSSVLIEGIAATTGFKS